MFVLLFMSIFSTTGDTLIVFLLLTSHRYLCKMNFVIFVTCKKFCEIHEDFLKDLVESFLVNVEGLQLSYECVALLEILLGIVFIFHFKY